MKDETPGPQMKTERRMVLRSVRMSRKRNWRRVTGAEARTYSSEFAAGESGGDSTSVGGMARSLSMIPQKGMGGMGNCTQLPVSASLDSRANEYVCPCHPIHVHGWVVGAEFRA